jgi:cytochrome c oxidase assembly protein subunit 15
MIQTLAQQAANAVNPEPMGLTPLLALFAAGSLLVMGWAWWVRPMNLALGFAATVAMWTLSYVAMLQPGQVAGELLFAGGVACVLAGGFAAGRFAPGEASGLRVGLVSATINLLVIGAFLRDEQGGGSPVRPVLYIAGLFAVSALLGAFGDRLGRSGTSARRLPSAPVLLGIVTAANILVMIVLGGLVTGYEAGLAVPDWPNSFGHNMLLYPISEMKGGIFYEHAHRLFGMLVGVTVLAFTVTAWKSGVPAFARGATLVLLAMVVTQGTLGGLRVTGNLTASMDPSKLSPSTALAIVHGMLGQLVFGAALVSAFAVSRAWSTVRGTVAQRSVRVLATAAFVALVCQLFLGASMRHLQVPPTAEAGARIPAWALHGHVTMAIVALVLVIVAGSRASKAAREPALRSTAKAVTHSVGLQFLLGIGALVAVLLRRGEDIPWWEATSTTAHQAVGALLIACTMSLAVLAWRATDGVGVSRPA